MPVKASGRDFIVVKSASQSYWDLQDPSASVAYTWKLFQYAFAVESVAARVKA